MVVRYKDLTLHSWHGWPWYAFSVGFTLCLGSNLISWIVHKRPTISLSSIESEYKALPDTFVEFTLLQALLSELGVSTPSDLYYCVKIWRQLTSLLIPFFMLLQSMWRLTFTSLEKKLPNDIFVFSAYERTIRFFPSLRSHFRLLRFFYLWSKM